MTIPFVDLQAQYQSIKKDIDEAIQLVIENAQFIGGPQVKQFEESFAALHHTPYCISCANGTDSLEIIMKAMGIKEGDEVIVPAISWISTSEAVSAVGAKPVFVDIEEEFYTINPELISEKITERTKAIIPVHLYGQPAHMPRIMELASQYGLKVIEDCAQAHLASIDDKLAGTWGNAASFSFYPGKNLGAYGDAGCIITQDEKLATDCRRITNHGQLKKHDHQTEGRNSRLDTLQAAILLAKLPHLKEWTNARVQHADLYKQLLINTNLKTPSTRSGTQHVFHLYVVRTSHREELIQYLREKNINTAIHYPKALPFLPCYSKYGHKENDFPVAYQCQHEILSLPMYPELTLPMIEYITDQIKQSINVAYL
jgi:dTDP-4-amino-4,6-dideoxygalactose transaminase